MKETESASKVEANLHVTISSWLVALYESSSIFTKPSISLFARLCFVRMNALLLDASSKDFVSKTDSILMP